MRGASAVLVMAMALSGAQAIAATAPEPTTLPPLDLPDGRLFIVYGDARFTDPGEHTAANPGARRALVAQIAAEHPATVVVSGDIPWHGGEPDDYRVFREESAAWQEQGLRILPTLGNHEFDGCEPESCLENWWQAFPALRGLRWYRVDLGEQIRMLALDSNAPLTPGSAQRLWIEHELDAIPSRVRFLIVTLHHPIVADDGWIVLRKNERSLRPLLTSFARHSHARVIVCAGHVHNYERFDSGGIVHLVSGGGGARPHTVIRGPTDRYRNAPGTNFHYLRFVRHGSALEVSMVRLEDADAPEPHEWAVRDRVTIRAKAAD